MNTYKKNYWTTRDGKTMKISSMETSHIENTIRYLSKHSNFYDQYGGSAWDIDSYWYEDNSHLVDKKIAELEEELAKREYYRDIISGGQY